MLRGQSEILEDIPQVVPENIQTMAETQTAISHRRHLSASGSVQGVSTSNIDSR